jgi:PqqD family protein of HPr-rel-A system
MTVSPIWRLAPGQRLLHRCWDGECVLYNDLSGDTHVLDEVALALLLQLRAAPQPVLQLAAACGLDAPLAVEDGPPSELDDAVQLDIVLDDLAALHLIEAVPC